MVSIIKSLSNNRKTNIVQTIYNKRVIVSFVLQINKYSQI